MSSQTLLGILEELPEASKFKEATERTKRIVEFDDKLVEFAAVVKTVDGIVYPVELPEESVLVAEYVDWTHDRKIAARNAREMAAFRMEMVPGHEGVDFGGLLEPRDQIIAERNQRAREENLSGAKRLVRKGLFGKKGGES